ncbi:hypothetical protein KIN20_028557 [Parelaphostrongylus tenuis]|uniref:Uncharacterized protein n=1 Tax=Parelaphostrongylus tenuis TaxID=148309 RepID=A0AAD5R195_PARTN|nr:hypothetical protein KIN20_028557 [Parelaphostrongylus tenuis]
MRLEECIEGDLGHPTQDLSYNYIRGCPSPKLLLTLTREIRVKVIELKKFLSSISAKFISVEKRRKTMATDDAYKKCLRERRVFIENGNGASKILNPKPFMKYCHQGNMRQHRDAMRSWQPALTRIVDYFVREGSIPPWSSSGDLPIGTDSREAIVCFFTSAGENFLYGKHFSYMSDNGRKKNPKAKKTN